MSFPAGCNLILPVSLTTEKSSFAMNTSNLTSSVLEALKQLEIEYFFLYPVATLSVAASLISFSSVSILKIDSPSNLISSIRLPTSSGISTTLASSFDSSSSPVSASPVSIP